MRQMRKYYSGIPPQAQQREEPTAAPSRGAPSTAGAPELPDIQALKPATKKRYERYRGESEIPVGAYSF